MPQVAKSYLPTSQGELHCRRCGVAGPVLVMLQILPFGTVMFETLMPLLAQAGLRCIALDLMGYGRSDKRPGPWLLEDFAANIDEAIDRLDMGEIFVLGGHFAGMVAASVAVRRGGGIRKLVLDGTPVWPLAYRQNIAAEMGVKPFTMGEDGQFVVDAWAQVMSMMRLLNAGFQITPEAERTLRSFAIAILETTYGPNVVPAMAGFDMAAMLPRIAVETLVLTSENDSQVRFFDTLMTGIAGARGKIFPGVHPMHDIGRPARVAEYAQTLTGFLLE